MIKNNLPERKEVAIIYKYLKTLENYLWFTQHDLREFLFIKLSQYQFSYIKISVILDITKFSQAVRFLKLRFTFSKNVPR